MIGGRERKPKVPCPPHPMKGWFFDLWLASPFGQYAANKGAIPNDFDDNNPDRP